MKRSLTLLAVVVAAGAGYWYAQGKLPQREGEVAMVRSQAPVACDMPRVPHPQAQNEADHRALGMHAQDRLFQMEIMRRLARGELAEVLGDKLLPTDTLFRSLHTRASRPDGQAPGPAIAGRPGFASLPRRVNRWQASHPSRWSSTCSVSPPRPFTAEDP